MAQGRKWDETTKEKAIAMYMSGRTIANVARELSIGYTTIYGWVKDLEDAPNFEEIRGLKRQEFIENAWECVGKAQKLLYKRLERAINDEKIIDELIEVAKNDEDLDLIERRALLSKLAVIKLEDVAKLATVIGTMYDKQALASNEPTSIQGGEVTIKRFEDL